MPFGSISNFPSLITLGEPIFEHGLVIFPVYNKSKPSRKIVDSSNIAVRELPEETVPFLEAENKSEDLALILDSEILAGGKQDRVLNQPVMLRPGQTSRVPVSCIEQGRWSSSVGLFASVGSVPSQLRSERLGIWTETSKSRKRHRARRENAENEALRRMQQHETNPQENNSQETSLRNINRTPLMRALTTGIGIPQEALFEREVLPNIQGHTWNRISQRRTSANYRNTTGSLKDVVEEKNLSALSFTYPYQSTGMIVCKNVNGTGRVQLVEWFDSAEIAEKRWATTLRQQLEGYNQDGQSEKKCHISRTEVQNFLTCLTRMNFEELEAYGCATTVTLEHQNHKNTKGVGVIFEGNLCHLSLISV